MADAFIYIDESHTPTPRPHETNKPFRAGVLVLESPADQRVIDDALAALVALREHHPDVQKTLDRSYFHASEDSYSARGALYGAIQRAMLSAYFIDMQWHHQASDSDPGREAQDLGGLHPLVAVLGSLSFFDGDYDAVHLHVARRNGSFTEHHRRRLEEALETHRLGAFLCTPNISSRFPPCNIAIVDGAAPGVQICDAMLWAAQRAPAESIAPERAGMRWTMKEQPTSDRAACKDTYEIGHPVWRPFLPKGNAAMSPQAGTMPWPEIESRMRAIENETRAALRIAEAGNRRIAGHLGALRRAAAILDGNVRGSVLDVARTFLLVCDTLPIYDPADVERSRRAVEMRLVAAFVCDSSRINSVRTRDEWDRSLHRRLKKPA